MTAQSQVPKLYQTVIEDVINSVREAFIDEGVDESVLNELKNIWQSKLTASKVLESDTPLPTNNDPMIAGPYLALQQQHNSANITLPGYRTQHQERQSNVRQPPVSVSSVPMFTTLSHPGAELSDAANMAYSSILQSQQGAANGAAANAAQSSGRSQLSAAATQPQYLFSSPGSGGPVMISQAQALRLQQQGRGGGRGSLPQVDGVLEEEIEDEKTSLKYVDDDDHESPATFDVSRLKDSLCPKRTDLDVDSFPTTTSFLPAYSYPHSSSASASAGLSLPRPINAVVLPKETSNSNMDVRHVKPEDMGDRCFATSSDDAAVTVTAASEASSTSASVGPAAALSMAPAAAKLCLPSGKHLSGKILSKKKQLPTSVRPKKGDKIEIVFQVDGNHSSSDDDDDDDDDGDLNEDDSSDRDPDDEDIPGVEDEPLNSGDDVSDNDPEELFDTENVVVCQYEKISRVRNKWRFYLKDGIMNIQGRDYVFLKASGEAEW